MLGKREGKGIHVQGVLEVEEHEGGKQEVGTEKGASTRIWPKEDGHCCPPLNLLRSRLPDAKLEAPGEGLGLGFLGKARR